MWDTVLYGIFWLLFLYGVYIELMSIYLDLKRMRGHRAPSGAWGGALGLFALLMAYAIFLDSRRAEKNFFTAETIAVLTAIGFQLVFHVLFPLVFVYCINRKDTQDRDR